MRHPTRLLVRALKSLLFIPAFLRNDDEDNNDEDGNADDDVDVDDDDKSDEDANVFLLSIESISGYDSLPNDDVDPISVGFDKTKIKQTTGKISKLCYTKEQQMVEIKRRGSCLQENTVCLTLFFVMTTVYLHLSLSS